MLATYVVVLGEAGLRCSSECLWLRWKDISFESGFLTVASGSTKGRRTKSGKSRKVPMTSRLSKALRDHFARFRFAQYNGGPTPWIFHHQVQNRTAEAGDRLASLRGSFDSAVDRSDSPPDLNQHDLRHRRATTWLAEGKPSTWSRRR